MGTVAQRLVPGAGASASAPGGSPAALAAPTAFAVAESGQVFVIGTGPDRRRCVVGPFINAAFARADAERWAQQDPQMHLELWVVTCITPVPLTCGTCAVDGTSPTPNDTTVGGLPGDGR